jgi:subtilisin
MFRKVEYYGTEIIWAFFLCLFLSFPALAGERPVIIGFHQKPGPSEQALIHGHGGHVKHKLEIIRAVSADLPDQAIAKLKSNPKVAYVEEDVTVMAIEPEYDGNEYGEAWGVSHIGSEAAHGENLKGAGVKVAVIDTGIDYNHPDLMGNYVGGTNTAYPDDDDPFDDSYNSHGTHVAGVTAAELNGEGVVGVAPEASLYAVKALDGGGVGLVSWIIAGLDWAVANHMDIVNMSLGADIHSQAFADACAAAYEAGILLVAAAGNTYGGEVLYPARFGSVIAVGATYMDDTVTSMSPVGPEVELVAPGSGINSTVSLYSYPTLYSTLSGTSQASPHVAGVAALVLAAGVEDLNGDGVANHQDVRIHLQATALDLGEPGEDDTYGHGLVSADIAVLGHPSHLVVIKAKGNPGGARERAVTLAGARFEITITNAGLSKVTVEVFEKDVYVRDLSARYRFGHKDPQEVTFTLDARNRTLDVAFIPNGKSETSAEIDIARF